MQKAKKGILTVMVSFYLKSSAGTTRMQSMRWNQKVWLRMRVSFFFVNKPKTHKTSSLEIEATPSSDKTFIFALTLKSLASRESGEKVENLKWSGQIFHSHSRKFIVWHLLLRWHLTRNNLWYSWNFFYVQKINLSNKVFLLCRNRK